MKVQNFEIGVVSLRDEVLFSVVLEDRLSTRHFQFFQGHILHIYFASLSFLLVGLLDELEVNFLPG